MQQSNLSSIINSKSNPSIEMLQKIATTLEVELWELFERKNDEVSGYIEIKGEIHKISTVDDIEKLLQGIKENKQ